MMGNGTLDGSADDNHWWPWTRKGADSSDRSAAAAGARLVELGQVKRGARGKARLMGEGSFLRPNFIQPYSCRNVLIEGVKIRNSPMWEPESGIVHQCHCAWRGYLQPRPQQRRLRPGILLRCIEVENCIFDTGDDCIAIKSGRNADE